MKKFLLVAVFFSAIATHAQLNTSITPHKGDLSLSYTKKSKILKGAGWSLLGAGTIICAIGLSQLDTWSVLSGNDNDAIVLTEIGGAMMIGSIPCLIFGGVYKRKATALLRNEKVTWRLNPGPGNFPALGLAINL